MSQATKVRVLLRDTEQHVVIPAEFRFSTNEVYVRRDAATGGLILSSRPANWTDVFAALDAAGFPDDFAREHRDPHPSAAPQTVKRTTHRKAKPCS